ncbi:hypothetical protein IJH26_03370 [Candidatus Saccharibacteria bacterium]|nr:hypothetical protein [Candidatus Saccharibacteria bacterium]
MEENSKEIRNKIRSLKAELSQTKSYYNNKISLLRQLETQLRNRPAIIGMLSQKLEAKQGQKLEETKHKLALLEKERDEKVTKLEDELNSLRKTYRENYDTYKEKGRKIRRERIEDLKIFLDRYKLLIISIVVIIVVIVIFVIASIIHRHNLITTEENRDYYISADEQFSFDCNIKSDGGLLLCEDRTITGLFSDYPTVKFSDWNDINVNGNQFARTLRSSVPISTYRTDDFDKLSLDGFDVTVFLTLENTVLNHDVAYKNISTHYSFTDADKALIDGAHSEWATRKAEEAAAAEKRAEERKAEEEKRAAEERAVEEKRAAEEEAVEEKRAAEEEAARQAELAERSGYVGQYIKDAESSHSDRI